MTKLSTEIRRIQREPGQDAEEYDDMDAPPTTERRYRGGDAIESGAPLRVLVADDHRVFAEMLSFALSAQPGMDCVGIAHSAADAVAMSARLQPDILIMDIEMPDHDGVSATRRVLQLCPRTVVVVVTAHFHPVWAARATLAGGSAFVSKTGSLPDMLESLRRARHGRMPVAEPTSHPQDLPTPPAAETAVLTPRERAVLECLGTGLHLTGIAEQLGISISTCRGYIKTVRHKLNARTRLEAVVKARNAGLL